MPRMLTIVLILALLSRAESVDAQCYERFQFAPHDTAEGDGVGLSVALGSNRVAFSAPWHAGGGAVYVADAETGDLLHKVVPADVADGDAFGWSVAISGSLLLAGSPGDDDRGTDSGSMYVFDIETGDLIAKLSPKGGAAGEQFGVSLGVEGSIAVVGASGERGAVYVLDMRDPEAPEVLSRFEQQWGYREAWGFGREVAISEGVAVIGIGAPYVPYAYLFDLSHPQAPVQSFELQLDEDPNYWDHDLGTRVGISGAHAVIGTYRYDYGDTEGSSASVYDIRTGECVATLRPHSGAAELFGWAVDVDDAVVAVSSFEFDRPWRSFVYLYDLTLPSDPILLRTLASSDPQALWMGWSVSLDGPRVAAGSAWDHGNDTESGTANLWNLDACECPADWNDDGLLDTRDVIDFLVDWSAGAADFNRDGLVDSRDVLAFLGIWASGC